MLLSLVSQTLLNLFPNNIPYLLILLESANPKFFYSFFSPLIYLEQYLSDVYFYLRALLKHR